MKPTTALFSKTSVNCITDICIITIEQTTPNRWLLHLIKVFFGNHHYGCFFFQFGSSVTLQEILFKNLELELCFRQEYIYVQNKNDLITLVAALKNKMESINYNLINSDKLRKMTESFDALKSQLSIMKIVLTVY